MKASDIEVWPSYFSPSEWPKGVLEQMDKELFYLCVFPLRAAAKFSMWPSSLVEAHVRKSGGSMHSTNGGKRLSSATDLHVSTYRNMIKAMDIACSITAIGGIGIYFNTNTPMIHVDELLERGKRLVWLVTKDGDYVYRENDPINFYKVLAEELNKAD